MFKSMFLFIALGLAQLNIYNGIIICGIDYICLKQSSASVCVPDFSIKPEIENVSYISNVVFRWAFCSLIM